MKSLATTVVVVILACNLTGCNTLKNRDVGTIAGAVGGGVLGNVLTGGNVIGTIGGAAGGAYLGNRMSSK